jgi:hypothetical protein
MEINTSQPKQKASQPQEASEQPKARDEQHYERSDNLMREYGRRKVAAQREMKDFGDPSEYDITSRRKVVAALVCFWTSV